MKKKPIYLYVLLGLAAAGVLLGIWGRFTANYTLPEDQIAAYPEPLKTELPAYLEKLSALSNSLVNNVFFWGGIAILIAAIVFLVRKDILKANISYIAYILFGLISTAYSYVATRGILYSSFSDSQFVAGQMATVTFGTVVGVGISLIFLGIVVFKLIQQQREAEKAEVKQEEALPEG